MEKNTVLSKLKLIGFILYFLILFAERLLAVILSPAVGGEYALVSGNAFNYIAYAITALSVVAGLVLMIRVLPKMFVSVFTRKAYDFDANRKSVILAATVILFGGMMHTGFTIAPVQFVSYGFLIAAMVVRTIECCREGKRLAAEKDELTAGKFRLRSYASVVSVIYLTLFAMAVPGLKSDRLYMRFTRPDTVSFSSAVSFFLSLKEALGIFPSMRMCATFCR